MKKVIALVSLVGFNFAWMGLESGALMPWQSLVIGAVFGPMLVASLKELGVIEW